MRGWEALAMGLGMLWGSQQSASAIAVHSGRRFLSQGNIGLEDAFR